MGLGIRMIYILLFALQVSPAELAPVVKARFNQIQTLEAELVISVRRPAEYREFLDARKQARQRFGEILQQKLPNEDVNDKFVTDDSVWLLHYAVDQGITWSRLKGGQVVEETNFDGQTWRSFNGKAGVVYDSPVDLNVWKYFGYDYRFHDSSPKAGSMLFDQIQQAHARGALDLFRGKPAGFGLAERSYIVSQYTDDKKLNDVGVRNLHILTFDPRLTMALTKVHSEYFINDEPTQPRRWLEAEWRYSGNESLSIALPTEFSEKLYETVTFPTGSLTRQKLDSNSGQSEDFEFKAFNTVIKTAAIRNVKLNQRLVLQAFEFPDGTLVNDRVEGFAYQVGNVDPEIEALLAIQNAFPVNSVKRNTPSVFHLAILFILLTPFVGWFAWRRAK